MQSDLGQRYFLRVFLVVSQMLLSSCATSRFRSESVVPADAPAKTEMPAGIVGGTPANAEYHFAMAQAFSQEGNSDRAIEEYKLATVFDPKSAMIHARLAAEYAKKGSLTLALEEAKESLKCDPQFIDARLLLGGIYSTSQEHEAALHEYNAVLKQDSDHEEAVVYKAQVLLELERNKDAIASLKSFVERNPESTLVWYYLGRTYQIDDKFREAVTAYRRALQLNSGFSQAGLALGFLYESKNMTDEAKRIYLDVYNDDQDSTAAQRLSTILLKEQKYGEALPYLESVLAGEPDNLNVRLKIGLIQMELKKYPESIAMFQSILAVTPDSDRVHYYMGNIYEETKDYPKAVESLSRIPTDSSFFEDATLHVVFLKRVMGDASGAESHLAKAMKSGPKYASFYLFQTSLYEDSDRMELAVNTLEESLEHFPDHERIRYYLGSLYDKQGKWERGVEQMESVLRMNAKHADALNYIGYTFTVKGIRLDEAEKLIRRALELKPESGYVLDSWGWYLFTTGNVGEAIVSLEKAVRLVPSEATVLDHLGDAYLRANLREKALAQYQEALRNTKDTKLKDEIERKVETLKVEIADRKTQRQKESNRIPATSEKQSQR